jgi:hypothetical protein
MTTFRLCNARVHARGKLAALMLGLLSGTCVEGSATAQTGSGPATVPRAVAVARATVVPRCTSFVDAAVSMAGDGSVTRPFKSIGAAVASATPGTVICVAEGTYAESLSPGAKPFTLAGGFQRGRGFAVRDSAAFVSRAVGRGGSFLRIEDPGPKGDQLTAIDGFDISGYAQAIVRDVYYSQRFDITNSHIHGNRCTDASLAGAGFHLNNVTGRIEGNVIRGNVCGRGGAGLINDTSKENTVVIERNLIDGNAGMEPDSSHGGGLYLFGKTLRITGNHFMRNTVTRWGGALYIGADYSSGQETTAALNWNVYRSNRAGIAGGGLFCDDGASCSSFHEIYDGNCGGNIFLDSGGGGPTRARFDHLTNVRARTVGCEAPGAGVRIDRDNAAPDTYSFVNAIFWGNASGRDFEANCERSCGNVRVSVSYSMANRQYANGGLTIRFGDGMLEPVDPLLAAPDAGDYHLQSTAGRWTAAGYVRDAVSSAAIGRAFPDPQRGGARTELGAFGNSAEASLGR